MVGVRCTRRSPFVKLHLHNQTGNNSRHTIRPTRGRSWIDRPAIGISDILKKHKDIDGVKLDIEGEELHILEHYVFPKRIKSLVFEWSYSVDPNPSRLKKTLKSLKATFKNVCHAPSALSRPRDKNSKYIHLPNRDVIITCYERR